MVSHQEIDLKALPQLVASQSIEDLYDRWQFDYATEVSGRVDLAKRNRFLNQFRWKRLPTSEEVRRLFNQVNTAFAEGWALSHPAMNPLETLVGINRILLFRQGKPIGVRDTPIAFGTRRDLDFGDPLRQFKLFRGVAPLYLSDAMNEYARSVERICSGVDDSLALALALIAVHPYFDANGRAARVVFSWLTMRTTGTTIWLDEELDGEFKRSGTGLDSTEHLMGRVIAIMCEGQNVVSPDDARASSPSKDRAAFQALLKSIERLDSIVNQAEFLALKKHYSLYRHIVDATPRFRCLSDVLE